MSAHPESQRLTHLLEGAEPTDEEAEHLLDCARCASLLDTDGDATLETSLRALRDTPTTMIYDRARTEAAVLAQLRAPKRRFARVAAVVSVVAMAASVALALRARQSPTSPASHATIEGAVGRVAVEQAGPDEVVALTGQATFRVTHLQPGQRFRVRAARDEVEVRGTQFRVDSDASGLVAVTVQEGRVEVRPACCSAVLLGPSERWDRERAQAAAASAAASATTPEASATASGGGAVAVPPTPATAPTAAANAGAPAAPAPSGIELVAQGTAAFDAGNYATAQVVLAKAIASEPAAAWARDARTLAGAAQVLMSAPDAIPGLSVSAESFDAAAKRAQRGGDARRATMARVGAARHVSGRAAAARWCALATDPSLSAALRAEAERGCVR